MRILQVAFKSEITGAEAVLLDLARGCLKAGHEVHAALPEDGPLATVLADLGCTCHIVAMRKTYDLLAARRLAKLIVRQEIDLVHSHGLLVNLLARLACRMAGRARCVNSVHLTRNLASGGRGDGWRQRLVNAYYRLADNMTARWTDRIIAVSNAVATDLTEQGVPAERITVIQNGVPAPPAPQSTDHNLRAELGLPLRCPIIGTIARLSPQKDMFTWLDVAERIAAAHQSAAFVIVGDGVLREQLERRADTPVLRGRVHFLGYRDGARSLLMQFDMFLLTSLWEGLPLVVLEAMASATPVVATAVDGTVEAIEHNRNGLLCQPQDVESLTEAVDRLLRDPIERARIGAAGHGRWRKHFSVHRMTRQTVDLYERIAPASDSKPASVCFVNLFDRVGGGERSLIELIDGLDANRFEPHAILPRSGTLADELASRGVNVHVLPLGRGFERASRFGGRLGVSSVVGAIGAAFRLGRQLRRIDADVVISNNLKAHVLTAPVCRLLRVPLIWHFRDILPIGRLRSVVTAMGSWATRRIVANSRTTAAQFADLPPGRVRVVYNGIRAAVARVAERAAGVRDLLGDGREARIGVIGALAPGKGQEEVIEAVAALPRVRLDVIGGEMYRTDGQPVGYRTRLRELSRRLGCSARVRFLGHQPDAAAMMGQYDLVVCPSRLTESFCRVGVEALAAGVPVVAADVGAVREVCGQWPAVRYVSRADAGEWANAVSAALADEPMRLAARSEGPGYVRRRFGLQAYQDRMQQIIISAT